MLVNNNYDTLSRFCYLKVTPLMDLTKNVCFLIERQINSHSPWEQRFLSCMAFSALRSLSHRTSVNSSTWFVLSLFFQPMHLNFKFLQQKVRLKWTFFLSDKQKNKSDIRATLLLLSFVNIKFFAKFSFSI